MNSQKLFMLLSFAAVVSAGCRLAVPIGPESKLTNPETIDVQVIWNKLAEYIDHGIIDSRHELSEYVKALKDNRDLQPSDVTAFDSAMPNAPQDFSTYSVATRATDASTLRTIR